MSRLRAPTRFGPARTGWGRQTWQAVEFAADVREVMVVVPTRVVDRSRSGGQRGRHWAMGRVAKSQQQTRVTARVRRIGCDHERVAGDQRVDGPAVQEVMALGARDDTVGQVHAAQTRADHKVRGRFA